MWFVLQPIAMRRESRRTRHQCRGQFTLSQSLPIALQIGHAHIGGASRSFDVRLCTGWPSVGRNKAVNRTARDHALSDIPSSFVSAQPTRDGPNLLRRTMIDDTQQ